LKIQHQFLIVGGKFLYDHIILVLLEVVFPHPLSAFEIIELAVFTDCTY